MAEDNVRNPADPTVAEQVGLTGAEEQALQQAGFAPEQIAAVRAQIVASDSGLSTVTVVPPALEGLTSQQWDVIGAITTTHASETVSSSPARLGPDIVETTPGSTVVFDEDPPPPPPQKPDLMPDGVGSLPLSPVEEPPPKPDLMPEVVDPLSVGEGPHPIKGEPTSPPQPVPIQDDPSLIDSGVWVDNSASGLTDEPGVWVDPPAIDPDRLRAMIREQSGVTDLGNVQEPDLGGVPQPGSADQIHSLDLSSVYEEVSREDSVFDSIYGQIQETKSSKANEEALAGAKQKALELEQQKSVSANQQSLEEMTNKDGLDLSSVYQEATPKNPSFDSVHDQIFPGEPTSPIDSAYDQTVPQNPIWDTAEGNLINVVVSNPGSPDEEPPEPPYEFEAPVLSPDFEAPDDFESPYGESEEHPGPNIPDLVEQPTPPGPPLQFDNTGNPRNALDASLFDPSAPGPTLDPSLLDATAPGATIDPALLDPAAAGPTIDPNLLDPSAPGPTLDPAQFEQGIVEPSGVAEPNSFADPYLTDPGLTQEPTTPDQDFNEVL